jgi:hypothetical protein
MPLSRLSSFRVVGLILRVSSGVSGDCSSHSSTLDMRGGNEEGMNKSLVPTNSHTTKVVVTDSRNTPRPGYPPWGCLDDVADFEPPQPTYCTKNKMDGELRTDCHIQRARAHHAHHFLTPSRTGRVQMTNAGAPTNHGLGWHLNHVASSSAFVEASPLTRLTSISSVTSIPLTPRQQ